MKTKTIVFKNLPVRLPIQQTAIYYLMLDYWKAPGWAWGVVGTCVAIIWIAAIVAMCNEEKVDIFKGK